MRPAIICLLLLILILSACGLFQKEDEFPIIAWYGTKAGMAEAENFSLLKEAGFTHSFSPFISIEENIRALKTAQPAGVKLFIDDKRLDQVRNDNDSSFIVVNSILSDYKSQPALAGYFLADKPGMTDFLRLANLRQNIARIDSIHPALINLLPTYATPAQLDTTDYSVYLSDFIDIVNPKVLSFSFFPVLETGVRKDYYYNLELIRKESLKHHIPFWGFVLSVHYSPHAKPNLAQMRFQAYSTLAYGAKGLEYFSYTTPPSRIWNFREALVDENGNPTPLYGLVKKLNEEIKNLCPILVRATSTGVYHSEPVPEGAVPLAPGLPITKIEGQNILAGFFKGPGRKQFVLLLNTNYHSGVLATIYLQGRIKKITEVRKNRSIPFEKKWGGESSEKQCQILFKAGEGKLFQLINKPTIFAGFRSAWR